MAPESKAKGHRWFAAQYDRISGATEKKLGPKVRPKLLADLSGRVLEVGAGTGNSFAHYPGDASVTATEPDPFMFKRAQARVDDLRLTNIELRQAPAEALPFEDASFDHVVSTLVLCTVRDQARALAEIKRVLKPDGTFRFWEHVRNDDSRLWGTLQDLIVPIWSWIGAGCHPNRRTRQAIEDAGFRIESVDREVEFPGVPLIWGVARRA